jgi:hypothetical protein
MPITPKRLKETLNFDVATKISNSDYQSFLAFCRKKRKTRAALARIAIRFFIKSQAETEAAKCENPPAQNRNRRVA